MDLRTSLLHKNFVRQDSRAPQNVVPLLLFIATGILFIGQLILGTSIYFSLGVYLSLIVTIITLSIIGFTSIAGMLIEYCIFRFLIFSQIAKTLYGQPGDSNLMAPDTTISVLLIGTTSICVAAILVSRFLRGSALIQQKVSPEILVHVRDISFVLGIICLAVIEFGSQTESGEGSYGGISGLAHQFSGVANLSVLAEAWRVLTVSEGRRSTSFRLYLILGVLTACGIAAGSKTSIAMPFLTYALGCFAFRRSVTKPQILLGASIMVFGILILYPLTNLSRNYISVTGSRVAAVGELLDRILDDPGYLFNEWNVIKSQPILERSLMQQGLYYLGVDDPLLERFLLIANTDVIVNAVNTDGPFGFEAVVGHGFELVLPTFLAPNKTRVDIGDQITWYYGLSTPGVLGFPTIGFFASCYATLEWLGIIVIPLLIMIPLFLEVQLFGAGVFGNVFGVYLLLENFHSFGEMGVESGIQSIFRNIPLDVVVIIILFYVANLLSVRGEHQPCRGN